RVPHDKACAYLGSAGYTGVLVPPAATNGTRRTLKTFLTRGSVTTRSTRPSGQILTTQASSGALVELDMKLTCWSSTGAGGLALVEPLVLSEGLVLVDKLELVEVLVPVERLGLADVLVLVERLALVDALVLVGGVLICRFPWTG